MVHDPEARAIQHRSDEDEESFAACGGSSQQVMIGLIIGLHLIGHQIDNIWAGFNKATLGVYFKYSMPADNLRVHVEDTVGCMVTRNFCQPVGGSNVDE